MTKVALMKCRSYDSDKVFDAVKGAVDLVGGIEEFVRPKAKVLIKPNLLSARPPEDAVDTHPEVVRAVVRLVKSAGGIPLIGDSPGGYGANIEEVFNKSGMRAMAKEEGAELVKFTAARFVDGIPFTRYLSECDAVISVPKLKTHSITVLTAAIKNMYGTVTGLYKAERHSKAPREKEFAKVITKVYSLAKPHLTVLDAIVAMEGDGPSGGKPRSVNLVMAGEDGVAIDAVAAVIMGLEPLDVAVTKEAASAGLGEADLNKIELAGDHIGDFIAADFKLPQTTLLKILPKNAVSVITWLIKFRPRINFNACKKCNLCKITCPVSAITIDAKECFIDYKKCVKCLCCQEVCPYKAIYINRNLLTKMVWG